MSCLSIFELSLTEQNAIALIEADRLIAKTATALDQFDSRAAGFPSLPSALRARGSNPSWHEDCPMIERQYNDHPPLRVCHCIRRPIMYQARGNNAVRFYVECAPCELRSIRTSTPEAAATAWNDKQTVRVDHQAVA